MFWIFPTYTKESESTPYDPGVILNMSISEVNHSQNIADLEILISVASNHPQSKNNLKLSELETLLNDAKLAFADVNNDSEALAYAVIRRETAFEDLGIVVTRIEHSLDFDNIDQATYNNIQTIICKLQGNHIAFNTENNECFDIHVSAGGTSSVRMSFTNRIAYFEKLVELLESEAAYTPEQEDLKISALRSKLGEMKARNAAAMEAATALSSSRMIRDEVFYDKEIGLIPVANNIKNHLKSICGEDSPQYNRIRNLVFIEKTH